ncbi:DUF676 domain-containing protein [Aphelenchoides bicaudatus]|nr:DUF676 domain-containing protein [Aphelenchoides bicaudatus]
MRLEAFPRFSINIELVEFNALELVHGYYQIRFRFKQTFPFTYDLKCDQKPSTSPKSRPQVHYQTAVSKAIKIGFSEQAVELNDVFNIGVDLHKRFDKFEPCNLEIQLELWFLEPETKPLLENYAFISKRIVNVLLLPDRSMHNHRHVFFEYFSFSAVSLTIHSCVTEMVFNQTKSLDTPLNEKLKAYYRIIMTRLLGSYLSMQNFIKNYAHVLTSPLKMDCLDIDQEIERLQNELKQSETPWLKFQDDVKKICAQLKQLFNQLIQLFNCCRPLSLALLEEFDQKRIRRFAEGFLFIEDSVKSLLEPKLNPCGRIFETIKKSEYLNKLPRTPIKVEGTDIEATNITLILEHRYLPTGATVFSTNGDNEILKIPQINTDSLSVSETTSLEPTSSRQTSRRSSTEKFVASCFPITRSSSRLPDEDSYGCISSAKSNHLSPNLINDRWIHVLQRIVKKETYSTQLKANNNSPNGTLKSQSVVDIIAKNTTENSDLIPSTSRSSSTESLVKSPTDSSPKNSPVTSPTNEKVLIKLLDHDRVIFAQQKELMKQKLQTIGYRGLLYSDSKFFNWRPYFSNIFNEAIEKRNIQNVHLVIFVHGLEGTSEDLSAYKNYLRIALPEENFAFLLSEANQSETWSDFKNMAENLLQELLRFIDRMPRTPHKISMITHSLGGLIVRTMLEFEKMKPLVPRLHTLITLNSPHLGLCYNQRTANWGSNQLGSNTITVCCLGIQILQFWKNSKSLEQLTMRDAPNFQDTFLYKLSTNGTLALFKTVILVGSYLDIYVPLWCALIEPCKASTTDPSALGTAYNEMLMNINESIVSSSNHTTLIKYSVAHALSNISQAQKMSGRACHIAVVDDDAFIEKVATCVSSQVFPVDLSVNGQCLYRFRLLISPPKH